MNTKSILLSMGVCLLVGSVYTAYVFTHAPNTQEGIDSQANLVISERTFFELYIPHQEVAAAAAQVILEKGTRLRPLHDIATKIAEEKIVEIEYLKGQYQALYGVPYSSTEVYRTSIRDLGELSPVERERAFLEDMIVHHETTILLAQKSLGLSISEELTELVQKSIAREQVEILSLHEVLQLLPQE